MDLRPLHSSGHIYPASLDRDSFTHAICTVPKKLRLRTWRCPMFRQLHWILYSWLHAQCTQKKERKNMISSCLVVATPYYCCFNPPSSWPKRSLRLVTYPSYPLISPINWWMFIPFLSRKKLSGQAAKNPGFGHPSAVTWRQVSPRAWAVQILQRSRWVQVPFWCISP